MASDRLRIVSDNIEKDEDLVLRFISGDDPAFADIYNRFAHYVAGVVFRILGHDDETNDIVQESFVEAYSSLPRIKEPKKIKAWLATIAVRQTYRCLSRRDRRRRVLKQAADAAKCVDRRYEEFVVSLYKAMDEIPPKLRIPWVLNRLQEETIENTAELCRVSVSTVKRRINKANQMMERRLGHE